MSHVHLFLLGQLERSYAVRTSPTVLSSARQTDLCQFAQWAVDSDDVANYLGYVEVALFNVRVPKAGPEGSLRGPADTMQIVSHHAFEEEEIFPFMVKAAGNVSLDHSTQRWSCPTCDELSLLKLSRTFGAATSPNTTSDLDE